MSDIMRILRLESLALDGSFMWHFQYIVHLPPSSMSPTFLVHCPHGNRQDALGFLRTHRGWDELRSSHCIGVYDSGCYGYDALQLGRS